METLFFLAVFLFPAALIGYCFVRDRSEYEEEEQWAGDDQVKRYYVERKRLIHSQKLEESYDSWVNIHDSRPYCPRCKSFVFRMVPIDEYYPYMHWPEEEKMVDVNPRKKDSPKARAKYICPDCGHKL